MALSGFPPTSTIARPGLIPISKSRFARSATSARIFFAIARPSIRSAGKVHCSRLPDQHDLDLSRVLKLRLDATRDFFGQRRHARVIDLLWRHDDADLAARLNGKDFFDSTIAGRDLLQPFESIHIRLDRLAPRPSTGSGNGI